MRVRGKVLLRRHLGDLFARWPASPSTEPRLVILMYHAIADAGHDPAQLTVAPRLFAEQMRWLVELGYRVVPLAAAAAELREGRLQSPVVALTFDDGYRSVYTHALPVLAQHGYPATVFLVPDVQARTLVGDGIPGHLGPLLGWREAREMRRHGISFGAHGMSHRKLSQLPRREVILEVGESKRAIEDALSVEVREFCYPVGSYDSFSPETEAVVAAFDFTAVCVNIAGDNRRPEDVRRLKRLRVSWVDDCRREIGKQCAGAYNWYATYQRWRDWAPSRPR